MTQRVFCAEHGDGHSSGAPNLPLRPTDNVDQPLAAALALLESMPLEDVPPPSPLPAVSRMPLRRNAAFVGREGDLRLLARMLRGARTAAIEQVVAVAGMAGIGKTQLAVEFVHRYGRYFAGGAFWLSFGEAQLVASEVALCGTSSHLNLSPEYGDLALDQQVALVRDAWESPLPRLLIFDNCEDEALLRAWLPRSGGSRVLVTSRRGLFDRRLGVTLHRLAVLDRAESMSLLRSYVGEDAAMADLDAIAAELGDLPLALDLAGSYLAVFGDIIAPDRYLGELRSRQILEHPSLRGEGTDWLPTEHERDVGRTFLLSYQRLEPADPVDVLAERLLARAACFASGEPIPHDLLLKSLRLAPEDDQTARQAVLGLRKLIQLGLLTASDQAGKSPAAVWLHRLLARFVAAAIADATAREAVEETLGQTAAQLNRAGYPLQVLPLQPHLRSLIDGAPERVDERMARLCTELAYHLRQIGAYTGAEPLYARALAIRETVLGPAHTDTATGLDALATILDAQGKYGEAQPLYARALTIREERLGRNHPDTAASLNGLARSLYAQGKFGEAQPLLERALTIREEVCGPAHRDTADSLNDLAYNLFAQQRYADAQPLLERALAIREAIFGPAHPDTAQSLNNLASNLNAQRRYADAQPLLERALTLWTETLGPTHPNTATGMHNLAYNLNAQGQYRDAQRLYEQALAIREAALGADHPDLALTLSNLATNLRLQGKGAEAQPLVERALAIAEQAVGSDHPLTQRIRANLQP